MDPENRVVKLCADGMRAEVERRPDDARALYEQAWEESQDDFEACIAAHYLARHQPSEQDRLKWNQVALESADRVEDERVRGFYPSLYLNMGHSFETVGDVERARQCYVEAEQRLDDLPDGSYGDMVKQGVQNALSRTS